VVWDRASEGRFPETEELLQRLGDALSSLPETDTGATGDDGDDDGNDDGNDDDLPPLLDDMDDDQAEEARRFFGVLCDLLPINARGTHSQPPLVASATPCSVPFKNNIVDNALRSTSRRDFWRHTFMQGSVVFSGMVAPAFASNDAWFPFAPSFELSDAAPGDENLTNTAEEDDRVKQEIKQMLREMLQKDSDAQKVLDAASPDNVEDDDDAVKLQIKNLITEMIQEEKTETATDQETKNFVDRLESQQQKVGDASPLEEKETQKMLLSIEKDEEKAEKGTSDIIKKMEQLNDTAIKNKEVILPEPLAPNRQSAAKASAKETRDFIATLRARVKADQDYISLLEYQQKTKISPEYTQTESIITTLKERIDSNKEFKSLYDDFLAKLVQNFLQDIL
jgi:chemotaxis protein histidine kinase CheA